MRDSGLLGSWVRRFLLEHLIGERNLARNTQRSYRDTLRLLLPFAARRARKAIDRLTVEDLTAARVLAFLEELEKKRGCGAATRNQRLAAVHSLAHFIAVNSPEHVAWCGRIRSIPFKKAPPPLVTYLEKPEIEAVLAAPDVRTAQGRKDYAVLLFLYNTGARADEAAHVLIGDLELGRVPKRDLSAVLIRGKGDKRRRCPLWTRTVTELVLLIGDRGPEEHVFLNRRGEPLTRFGVHALVERHARKAAEKLPVAGEQARRPAHDPAHDGNASLAGRSGHQHDPSVAGARFAGHHERVRGSRSGDEGEGPGDLRNQRGWGSEGMAAERGRDGVLTKPVGAPPLRGPARLPAGRSRIMWFPIPLEVAQFQGRASDRHIIGLVT